VFTAGVVTTGAVDGVVVVSDGSDAGAGVVTDDVAGVSVEAVSGDGSALFAMVASSLSGDDAGVLDGGGAVDESPDGDASASDDASIPPVSGLVALPSSRSGDTAFDDAPSLVEVSAGDALSDSPSAAPPSGTKGAVVVATSANSVAASTSVVVGASAAPLGPSGDVPAQAVAMNAATSPRARCLRLPGRVGRRVRMGTPRP